MQKILLALQFWDGDKNEAMKRARLIADLEPRHSEHADFLFISRFDCTHDQPTILHVSRKFNAHVQVNRRRGEGWPLGCNELFFGMVDWVYTQQQANKLPDYKAVLAFEADACPLRPGWIQELSAGWDSAQAKVYGPLLTAPGPHINGNAMFSCDPRFLHWLARTKGGCSPSGGWDYLLYREFKEFGAVDAPKMRSWWKHPTLTEKEYDDLLSQNACFLHGVKDDSNVRLVRSRFL